MLAKLWPSSWPWWAWLCCSGAGAGAGRGVRAGVARPGDLVPSLRSSPHSSSVRLVSDPEQEHSYRHVSDFWRCLTWRYLWPPTTITCTILSLQGDLSLPNPSLPFYPFLELHNKFFKCEMAVCIQNSITSQLLLWSYRWSRSPPRPWWSPACSPSWPSSSGSGTRSWSAAPTARGGARSQSAAAAWGSDWSGIPDKLTSFTLFWGW